jgi:hypothetical protein
VRVGGVVGLDLLYVALGYAFLAGIGLVRSRGDALRLAGLALLGGWAILNLGSSFALMAGANASLAVLLVIAALVAGVCVNLIPRVRGFSPARTWTLSPAGLLVGGASTILLVVYLGELLRRIRLAQPASWDAWAFWVPKAMALVYSGGLGTGPGSVESFANPDYPPFVPAADASVFRFAGTVDPGLLPVQHWVLAVALFAALAGLLWHRVSPGLLMPPLAALALLPVYSADVGSLLGDEALLTAFAVAGVAAALWLLEREPRYLVLYALFGSVMALSKNEGFTYVILMGIVLALASWRRRAARLPLVSLAIPILAMVPWKIWLHVENIPPNGYYSFGNVLKPHYLSHRWDRLGTTIHQLPQYYLSLDRWLITIPLAAALVVVLARRAPRLALFATATVVVGFLGNVVVYWISTPPVDWYIATSANRTATGPLVFTAALLPLLLAEAYGATQAATVPLRQRFEAAWTALRARPTLAPAAAERPDGRPRGA